MDQAPGTLGTGTEDSVFTQSFGAKSVDVRFIGVDLQVSRIQSSFRMKVLGLSSSA